MIIVACMLLPEIARTAAASADSRRLLRVPGFLAFIAAAGLIQVSHADLLRLCHAALARRGPRRGR